MIGRGDADDKVLELRSQGRSFAKIARELGLGRASAAILAFRRSLRGRPLGEQERLLAEELGRLDTLAAQVCTNGAFDAHDLDRRLWAVEHMRAMILAT